MAVTGTLGIVGVAGTVAVAGTTTHPITVVVGMVVDVIILHTVVEAQSAAPENIVQEA